jgi:prepilin peptidase CpaA
MHALSQIILPTLLIVAAASDVMSFRIPNWLTLITAVLFFPMALATGMPMHEFGLHVLSGALLFVAGFLFFQVGLFGGGDAKLMAAAGLWFGTSQTLPFLFLTAMVGGVLAIVVGLWSVFLMSWEIEGDKTPAMAKIRGKLSQLKPNVPYGFAFALGGILAFKDSWWMTGIV